MIYSSHMKKRRIYDYTAVFQEEKEGGYSVWVPDLPGCASQGETLEEALENIKEAVSLYLEDTNFDDSSEKEEYRRQFIVPIRIHA